ncbi:MAG: exodeoxyribonuclease VII large subunit [Myxococcaceae bacterium]|nr:exodeoxyribonuclease VII large subunit [Myxococcaceae bacterium]
MKQADLFGGPSPAPDTEKAPEPKPKAPAATTSSAAAVPAKGPVAAHPVFTRPPPPEVPAPAAAPVPAWRAPAPAPLQPLQPQTPKAPRVLSVGELTRALKDTLEPKFARVLVQGEVSGFRGPNARGHWYFALKDGDASIDVKVWESTTRRLKFALRDGLKVVAEGSIDLYEPAGRYSLVAHALQPSGVGAMALAFEQLKAKLLKEGLFGDQRIRPKRALPRLPRRIGVVTSVSGAALKDFLKVLHRRHPRLAVLVANTRVQGDGAALEIARAIHRLGRQRIDVLVVTRGGGSVEDLWSFNEEPVARAIFDCPVPVVSAVGHEIDTTLADFVADVRAPTPSAAAELVAPVLADLLLELAQARSRLERSARRLVNDRRAELRGFKGELGDPRRKLSQARLELSELTEAGTAALRRQLRDGQDSLRVLTQRLQLARPQARVQAVRAELKQLSRRLERVLLVRLREERAELGAMSARLRHESPQGAIRAGKAALAQWKQRLGPSASRAIARRRDTLAGQAQRLDALSPLAILRRGYAIPRKGAQGPVIRSADDVQPGEVVVVRLAREDELEAKVTAVKKGKR